MKALKRWWRWSCSLTKLRLSSKYSGSDWGLEDLARLARGCGLVVLSSAASCLASCCCFAFLLVPFFIVQCVIYGWRQTRKKDKRRKRERKRKKNRVWVWFVRAQIETIEGAGSRFKWRDTHKIKININHK